LARLDVKKGDKKVVDWNMVDKGEYLSAMDEVGKGYRDKGTPQGGFNLKDR